MTILMISPLYLLSPMSDWYRHPVLTRWFSKKGRNLPGEGSLAHVAGWEPWTESGIEPTKLSI